VPANISFHALDVYAPIPDSLQNVFDVVHVRLLIALIRNGDPRPVLMHLMQMLKPGGVLQWDELDIASLFMYPPGSSPDACNSFEKRLVSMYPGAHAHHSNDWITQLSSIFAECGFQMCRRSKRGSLERECGGFGLTTCLKYTEKWLETLEEGLKKRLKSWIWKDARAFCFYYECAVALGRKALES
jgi:hypothetical protein